MNRSERLRFDLLRLPAVRWLLARPIFPLALQVAVLMALLLLVVNGWGLGDGYSGAELKTLRKTNLTTLSVWGLWWPVMVALAILAGRVWCTICPMELVARVAHRLGRRVSPGVKLPRALRLGWLALAAYLVLQVAVAALALHRVPQLTAVMLLCLLGFAGLAGAIFRHPRSFCVALCPAGPLLSVYSRFTPFQLDRRDDPTCAGCTTRDCVSAATRDRLDGRGCPSLVRPFQRQPADGCVLCLQCAKTCPHDNMGLGLVAPGSALRRPSLLGPVETAFVMIASGFVTHEVVGEIKWLDASFHLAPEALAELLPVLSSRSWEGLWYLLLYPAVIWGLVALVMLAFGKRGGLGTALRAVATGAAPVVALAHLAKALAKLASWGGFLPLSLVDPRGVSTFEALAAQTLATPGRLVGLSVVGWVILLALGWLTLRLWPRGGAWNELGSMWLARLGTVLGLVLFGPVLVIWALGL